MSELIDTHDNRATIRWKLLTGASAAALAAYFSMSGAARAEDAAQPAIWFEADGQFSLLSGNTEPYIPPFVLNSQFDGAQKIARKHPPSEWDEGATISFQPSASDWMFSLGVRYGKSARHEAVNQYTKHAAGYFNKYYNAVQSTKAAVDEKHLILDFQAGKDFGLGMFGHDGSSVLKAGIRYAQFTSRNNITIHSVTANIPSSYYIFDGALEARRKFSGIGPSLSWDASADLAGNAGDGMLTLDWGVNGALLFGRQRAKLHHEKTSEYQPRTAKYHPSLLTTVYHTAESPARSKTVTVPALGAYAAISLRYTNAKVTFGYRYDNYFGAIDGGIDASKKQDRSFMGPYASISIGVGD